MFSLPSLCLFVLRCVHQALVPSGSETQFSYGHHLVSVPLPLSMSAVREVRPSQGAGREVPHLHIPSSLLRGCYHFIVLLCYDFFHLAAESFAL